MLYTIIAGVDFGVAGLNGHSDAGFVPNGCVKNIILFFIILFFFIFFFYYYYFMFLYLTLQESNRDASLAPSFPPTSRQRQEDVQHSLEAERIFGQRQDLKK